MQVTIRPFEAKGNTSNAAVGTSTANFAIPGAPLGTSTVRLANVGANVIFVNFGTTSAVTAALATSIPILPNSVETFLVRVDNLYVAHISAATGNTLYATFGESS